MEVTSEFTSVLLLNLQVFAFIVFKYLPSRGNKTRFCTLLFLLPLYMPLLYKSTTRPGCRIGWGHLWPPCLPLIYGGSSPLKWQWTAKENLQAAAAAPQSSRHQGAFWLLRQQPPQHGGWLAVIFGRDKVRVVWCRDMSRH